MHIPENYLSPSTCAVFGVAMIPLWTRSLTKVREELSPERLPLLGIGAAFSFLVMMLNLPLPGGTTGHAVGAALLAILLGPWSASLAVSMALLVQALFFGDGGILPFAANCFNMAVLMPFAASFLYRTLSGGAAPGSTRERGAAFVAAWTSLNLAAFSTAVMFGIQPLLFTDPAGQPLYAPYPLSVAIPAMMVPHLLVAGVAEGIATVLVLEFLRRTAPSLVARRSEGPSFRPAYILLALLVAASPLGLLAAGTAWGEWGAEEIQALVGFIPRAFETGLQFEAPVPDYAFPGLSEVLGYVLSAAAGTSLLLGLFALARRLWNRTAPSR